MQKSFSEVHYLCKIIKKSMFLEDVSCPSCTIGNRRQKFGTVLPWKIVLEQACVHRAASFPSRRRRTDCSSSRAESQDNSHISRIRRLPMCVFTIKLHMSHVDLEFCIGLLFAESGPLEALNPSDQRTPQERDATSLAQRSPFSIAAFIHCLDL